MIEIYCDAAGEWRFRIKGLNGEVMAVGEGYTQRTDALRGVKALISLLQPMDVDNLSIRNG